MNIDDLRDNLKSQLAQAWSRVEDSSFYNQTKDRFYNLSPTHQKLTLMGIGALIALVIISIPYSYYSQASDNVSVFEDKRNLIRELLKVTRESSEVPDLPSAPAPEELKSRVENVLSMAHLLPEQMKGVEVITAETALIPKALLESGLRVTLAKLNLRQIVDLGYNIQNVSPSVKMSSVSLTANSEDPRYFDMEMKLVSLAVPRAHVEAPEEPEASDNKNASKKKPFKRGAH
ncbi:MAG: hypothetical protein ACXWRE_12510 [Pseudobdellovibrionaceae bacterium]